MEIEGSDGSKTKLKPYSTIVFGRGNGFHPNDLSVSRRHISFELNPSIDSPDCQTSPRVSFEVLGKNPVWVYRRNEDGKIKAFKRFQKGELDVGDMLRLSPNDPGWFIVKEEKEVVEERESKRGELEGRFNDELSQSLEISNGVKGNADFGLDSVDVSSIDPIQEFGFLVIGHEFDHYPKQVISNVKNWNWFLEDPRRDSDEAEISEKRGRRGGRKGKRKKTKGEDEENDGWTSESEDDGVVTTKTGKVQRTTYQTRSKDGGKPTKNTKDMKSPSKMSTEEEECEDDETLGGFIVEDDTVGEDDGGDDDKEEESFVEDEDEDKLED